MDELLDKRPIIVAIAGPNGAGKSTFYEAFLRQAGLRYINADEIGRTLGIDAYAAAKVADGMRRELVARRESFVFETVFSDPVGEKVAFLKSAAADGYSVVLCFVGLNSTEASDTRVAMQVSQGGHDVPPDKIVQRYPRTLANLARAVEGLPAVFVYDNSDLERPFELIAEYRGGKAIRQSKAVPRWFKKLNI